MREKEIRQLGVTAGRESQINFERVTTETLLADNQSAEAYRRRSGWMNNRHDKNLTLLDTCSDARLVTPNPTQSVVIRSVAAGRDLEPFTPLLNHGSIRNIHILGHHAGNQVVTGNPPKGCGGLSVKEHLLLGNPSSDVERWVSEHVCHSDGLYHALNKAKEMVQHAEKTREILLSTQDHLDHTIFPMIFIPDGEIELENYDRNVIYRQGIPCLSAQQIADTSFLDYFDGYYDSQFPSLFRFAEHNRNTQLDQNPHLIMITTNIRPPEVCLPNTTRRPNSVFVETLARSKNKAMGDEIEINKKDIENVIDQAEYPVTHFSNLRTLYAETGNFDQSQRVADSFFQRPWFDKWYSDGGKQVITGSIRAGIIREISYFKP